MNEVERNIQEIEITIEEAKACQTRKNTLLRLYDNPDFKDIILEGFFKEEAERIVSLRGSPNCRMGEQGAMQYALANDIITSIGGLRQFLITIETRGNAADQALVADEETHQQLLNEQLGVSEV